MERPTAKVILEGVQDTVGSVINCFSISYKDSTLLNLIKDVIIEVEEGDVTGEISGSKSDQNGPIIVAESEKKKKKIKSNENEHFQLKKYHVS